MNLETINTIKKIAEPLARQEGLFLVDVEVKHQKIPELWVLVDTEGKISLLDACAKISRELGGILEDKHIIQGTYRLNVSSPGVARPLSDKRQYVKNKGRNAKVKYKVEDAYITSSGTLAEVNEHEIVIQTDAGNTENILFDSIVETKIVPKI